MAGYPQIKVKCLGKDVEPNVFQRFLGITPDPPYCGCGFEWWSHESSTCPKCGSENQQYIAYGCEKCGKILETFEGWFGGLRIENKPERGKLGIIGTYLCDECYVIAEQKYDAEIEQAKQEKKAKLKAFIDEIMKLSPEEKLDTILTMLVEGKRIL